MHACMHALYEHITNHKGAHHVGVIVDKEEEEKEAVMEPSQNFVDVYPVQADAGERCNKLGKQPVKFRKAGAKRFDRQVSLETGVAAMAMEGKNTRNGVANKDDKRVLTRNGKSLGGEVGGEVMLNRKGDFSIFRTKSTLTKQNSLLPLRKDSEVNLQGMDVGGSAAGGPEGVENQSVPAGRYFAALRGPELDQVRDHEDILLPKDELWPFLLRFPIGCFGMCLGLGSQTILWRSLSSSPSLHFLSIPPLINLILWLFAVSLLLAISITYSLKSLFFFEAIRREYFHPVRINFFFAPWIACMFLTLGAPPSLFPHSPHPALWCSFMAPVFLLELKIYGQWLSGGKRRLCKVANPSSHLSVIGNFVGAILAAKVGWIEPAKFLFAIGLAHYLVVFVTLYQRLPTNEALPKELHPVYSMFIATPAAASLAWSSIYNQFDAIARTFFFIALFLYMSLVVRINFFRGFKFSIAWWSYTFPMTTASLATIKYAEEVPCFMSKALALSLSFMSSTMVSLLFISTLLHAFFWRSLFPNDLAIAITKKKSNGARALGKQKSIVGKKPWSKHSSSSPLAALVSSSSTTTTTATTVAKNDDQQRGEN
ncbi:S-type anion channel protein [Dioscorea alata]|uniref:S-type anion channel protein n=1 Tax=Dioscorea alata TaxID=55571 RepID=A0ACB7U048_DIOAL|nr:S-type anion channel protein [Dioscorea alata]